MKTKFLCALLAAIGWYGCNDSTPDFGKTTIHGNDSIPSGMSSFEVTTRSILADSVFARSNTSYLGRYTDSDFGEFTADFIAQFNCTDDFEFPEELSKITAAKLTFVYKTFFGDSTASMRLQVDTLNKVIPEGDRRTYYTSIKPEDYYDVQAKPIGQKAYAATGLSVDTIRSKTYYQSVKLPLSLGQYIYNKYVEDKKNFKDSDAFIKNVLKGVYVHCTHGDGVILYIDDLYLTIQFEGLIKSSSGKKDSVVYSSKSFAATKEVIHSNRFQNSDKLKELVEDRSCTYVKSPAGIMTEVTLPIQEIYESHQRDSLNAAVLSFTRYNDKSTKKYRMETPPYLLLLRKSQTYKFFEENSLYNGITSFVSAFNKTTNTYAFNNIAQLVQRCINEKRAGEKNDPNWLEKNPDWDKVVLIPISVTREKRNDNYSGYYYSSYYRNSSESAIIQVQNNLDLESVRLVGGTNKLSMQVLYTTF